MPLFSWPHAHLPHALRASLLNATVAEDRIYTALPAERTYPLLVVAPAGLGLLGLDSAIQADEPRLQVDSWSLTSRLQAATLDAQVFRLLDARFPGSLRDVVLQVEDDARPGDFYQVKLERISRAGGGDPWFDELARCFRVTTFYTAKVNL